VRRSTTRTEAHIIHGESRLCVIHRRYTKSKAIHLDIEQANKRDVTSGMSCDYFGDSGNTGTRSRGPKPKRAGSRVEPKWGPGERMMVWQDIQDSEVVYREGTE
jgi:hypothetical protein